MKNKTIKRLISLFLCVALVATVLPIAFFPVSAETTGTAEFTHLTEIPEGYTGIYTKADLRNVQNNSSGKFILMNDIEFTAADFAEGGDFDYYGLGWKPICDFNPFTGIFDGNGYAIKNLYINTRSAAHGTTPIGLFGICRGAIIKNLGMINVNITASGASASTEFFVGAIVGRADGNCIISNCYSSGKLTINGSGSVGGIVGYSYEIDITKCNNTATVASFATSNGYGQIFVGGIIGKSNYTYISNCFNTGTILSKAPEDPLETSISQAGGIAGYAYEKTISNCFNIGKIEAFSNSNTGRSDAYAGGIVGQGLTIKIINCYNTADISASAVNSSNTPYAYPYAYAGGIAGYGYTTNYCYNIGNVSAEAGNEYIGGIVGYNSNQTENCYYLDNISKGVGDGKDTCVKCTFEEMKLEETFIGFEFENPWTINSNDSYKLPQLKDNLHYTETRPIIIGAQYRLPNPEKGTVAGLRFLTEIAKNETNNDDTIEKMGTLIMPSDLLNDADLTFTDSGLINGRPYLDIEAVNLYENTEEKYAFTAVIVEIPENRLDREFVAVSYIIYTDGTVAYSDACIRSVNGVQAALAG